MTHKSDCSALNFLPRVGEYQRPPGQTITFDTPEEQENFHRYLTNGSNMQPSVLETTAESANAPSHPSKTITIEDLEEDFRKQFDELKLKPPKNSMPGLERELIIDYWRKAIQSLIDQKVIEARIDELKHIDNPVDVRLYFNGLISVADRITQLNKEKI